MNRRKFRQLLLSAWFLLAAITLASFYVWFNFSLAGVHGESMEPTFSDGDFLIINDQKMFEKNQIVIFKTPDQWLYLNPGEANQQLIKRIGAAPGDVLKFDGKSFFVNDAILWTVPDNYDCNVPNYEQKLGKNQIFALGDNAAVSLDSRRIFCRGGFSFFIYTDTVKSHGNVLTINPFS